MSEDGDQGHVTRLLKAARGGDPDASARLHELLSDELRNLAHFYMRSEVAGHTLQTTALVNEAYLKLAGREASNWENRRQFLTYAAHAMRSVLVDHARSGQAQKRGGGWTRAPLDDVAVVSADPSDEIIAMDEALGRLEQFDERKARVVELRFFGGMEVEETARVLDISPSTVNREWRLAKAWLRRDLEQHAD